MATRTLTEEQKRKQQFWKQHIENCNSSGSSQVEYCHRHKLSTKSFTYWKRKFKHKGPVSFVPLEVQPAKQLSSGNSSSLVVSCKDGYRIEIKEDFNPKVLAEVLRTLREL